MQAIPVKNIIADVQTYASPSGEGTEGQGTFLLQTPCAQQHRLSTSVGLSELRRVTSADSGHPKPVS